MAYRKVNADQRTQGHAQYLDNDDLQATTLELEWDMEKELEEPGFDHFQLDGTVDHHSGNSQNTNIDLEPIQPSASPKGRFQRLQEDPDYVSHYTRPAPKSKRCNFCRIFKLFCTVLILFIFGILIGYYAHKKCPPSPTPSEPSDPHFYHDILKEIKAENIQKIFRDLIQLPRKEEDTDIAMKLLVQWTSCGLEDVQLVNYSVLLDLPGSSSNTVTLKNSGECFYPSGQKCYRETKKLHSQDLLYSYAAYSAKGTLEAEVIDVQYGTVEDLVLIQAMTNVTNKIALLKLGQSPLLYKLSLLEEVGFGGVLLYVDPCDLPKTQNLSDKAFMVSLNNGGDPSTPGYPSIDGNYRQNRSNLTSLLVQPISALLVKRLVSLPEDRSKSDGCIPLKLAMTEKRIISLNVQTVPTYKTISNVIGYLKGSTFPDRYVIVGSHHNSVYGYSGQEWASSTAVITAFIQALMRKVKRGWRPDRTIVFCSWGGTSFGNIGSYEWAEDLKKVLQRNVVAYVSLHNPVRGNSSLHPVASPSLQQLATERQSLTCLGKMKCPGSNVSSVQMQGDSDYFINHLGVPTVQFSYEDIKTESPSFLFEALFPAHNTVTEELDPLFNLHETIAKLTGEVTLQIASEPVLPFNALDIALEVQNSLKGDQLDTRQLLAMASRLRDSAELFQSDEMRPANDPKERAPIRVRMLNDVLQGLEKNFLVQQAPPGFYRNILYRLDEKMSQFSVLLEALEHCKLHQSNETLQAALSKVLNSINSAQVYFKTGLDVFETAFAGKK
ncbi:inactive N-acetylated-alpha-linked acidic dipeptidase-like protein 2 isoform X2 [Malaclemys terrapin pileata]|nr:inactive N-acetylated-alpha-linked acidic dipeptidase-like protein 2 isoform X2 [Malaclemys terrapin pileata]XP_053895827.1 inactive N-acetylated-alpha-linked acidic dipeptidase-like protein 2 isoform X2 [Malaclemys terrapin pileata]XP_053895828.1 inactive N-acetylated-alpha-linked acidic dipeptidase-like protein 2 isoform X2 [Malaclemys terrapin pileata]XP_053895829.1 inactive N-acetylated-alpha-linked acidic dipeptidase-like protein 2 isoform X2 [Malaclemys terrapin pileata]XP_053895830.1 